MNIQLVDIKMIFYYPEAMNNIEDVEQLKFLLKDGKLNEAYSLFTQRSVPESQLSADYFAVACALVKGLCANGNFKQVEDVLTRTLPSVSPRDDHYFLGLADELTQQSENNVATTQANTKNLDKLIDLAIRIREELIGPDASTAEVIIDSVMTNLQRARQSANSGMAVEAASRLTRCRSLMAELNRVREGISRPADLLIARVATLKAFFAHSQGNKTEALENYQMAIKFFDRVAAKNKLERTDLFELFIQQGQHFNLSASQKQQYERLKKTRGLPKGRGTMHKIRAFPSTEHIEEIIQKAHGTRGKTFYLTSLGFLGTQSLNVSAVCGQDGDMVFKIGPSKSDGQAHETLTLHSGDAQEILRHIKDLWKKLQVRPGAMLTVSSRAAQFAGQESELANKAGAASENKTSPVSAAQNLANSIKSTTNYYDKGQSFEGNLKTMPSLGLIQTIGLNQNSGALEVSQLSGQMVIYFDKGKPIHGVAIGSTAIGASQPADLDGVDVLYQFVMQQEGWFRFVPDQKPDRITIKVRPDQFLLEAAALFDENKYLKSLGLTMYSALFLKESLSDWQELAQVLKDRGIDFDEYTNQLYQAIAKTPIASETLALSELSMANWVHSLYKLVQSGLVVISNEGLDDHDVSQKLVTTWSYDKRQTDQFINTLYDPRSGLLRFEFLVYMLEREFERARTQMWPLSLVVFELRKRGKELSQLSLEDKELVQLTLAQISDTKRPIDWLCHFQGDQFAILMPGLDKGLAAMFARNFIDVCVRNLGKLKSGQGDWEYSFGLASLPVDTIEWPRMVGFAVEAQRHARISRDGLGQHGQPQ